MKTNRAGLRLIIAVLLAVVTATAVISYSIGVAEGKLSLHGAIADLQSCNKALSNDLYEAKKELLAREQLLQYSLYAKKRLPK
jgi:replication-associated recombination protein RarA